MMVWKILLFLIFSTDLAKAFPFIGTWTDHHKSAMIHVSMEKISGFTTDVGVEMDIVNVMNNTTISLHNVRITHHPDWSKLWKFRPYSNMFRKIKEQGMVCSIMPMTDTNHVIVLIDTTIKVELFRIKNDFKDLMENGKEC